MVEALEGQMSKAGYDYGWDNSTPQGPRRGDGADAALNAAGGNFDKFNREQQAMIIQHYYVRRYEDAVDYTAWLPYAKLVYAG